MTMFIHGSGPGTTSRPVQSGWEAEAVRRALALKDLPEDWDRRPRSQTRRPHKQRPPIAAINAALEYIGYVAQLNVPVMREPFVAPLEGGGVQLEWDQGDRHVEIEILPEGTAKYTMIHGAEITTDDFSALPGTELQHLFGWLTATP